MDTTPRLFKTRNTVGNHVAVGFFSDGILSHAVGRSGGRGLVGLLVNAAARRGRFESADSLVDSMGSAATAQAVRGQVSVIPVLQHRPLVYPWNTIAALELAQGNRPSLALIFSDNTRKTYCFEDAAFPDAAVAAVREFAPHVGLQQAP